MRTSLRLLTAAAAVAALAFAGPTAADNPQLAGVTGPGFTISLADANGNDVRHLDPGTYTLTVNDRSEDHDFHLFGPGVDVATTIDFVGTKTFTVTLTDGSYTYVCDPHASVMMGGFTAGTPPPPPTPPKQTTRTAAVRVGPGLSLVAPKRLSAGAYVLTVTDRSAKDNV